MNCSKLLFLFLIIASCTTTEGQKSILNDNKSKATIGFYNVENLFDIIDDPLTFDEDFTPESDKQWTLERYNDKLQKLASVIALEGMDLPLIFGLCEVENEKVLVDLVNTGELKSNMSFVHREGADGRGIDVALLYRRDLFKPKSIESINVPMPEGERTTRDILYVNGKVKGFGILHVFVNHWPSRNGGAAETEHKRLLAAQVLRDRIDMLLKKDPDALVVCMGDFNDYPENKSVEDILGARSTQSDGVLINLMAGLAKEKRGSYNYRGSWGFLDQIIVSPSLLDGEIPDIDPSSTRPYFTEEMIFKSKRDEKPNKTYGGTKYYGGYSDHLPVIVEIDY